MQGGGDGEGETAKSKLTETGVIGSRDQAKRGTTTPLLDDSTVGGTEV